jgi:four helix bundle protein
MSVHLKTQLARAAAGIALNLQEGAGRVSFVDRRRFYRMAYGSFREARAVLDLVEPKLSKDSIDLIDHLGACLYKLAMQKS